MCKQCFVIVSAVWALIGSLEAVRADTPVGAPEPELAEQSSDSEAPPSAGEPEAGQGSETGTAPGPAGGSDGFRTGKGWFLGASVGIGSVTYSTDSFGDRSNTGTFLNLRFGGMLSPRFAVSVAFWSDGHREEFDETRSTTQNCLGVVMGYWATPRLWFKAGLGTSRLTTYRLGRSESEFASWAYMISTGYEILSHDSLSVDLSLHILTSNYEFVDFDTISPTTRSTLSLHAGVNWY